MNVREVKLLISATDPKQYPKPIVPEILLVGRSNVGKSSFINQLIGRKNLAYTSNKPGKTQTLNFYDLDGKLRLVDAPGYGYAKVSKASRRQFAQMIDAYLKTRENLELVLLLVDGSHLPTKDDVLMLTYLKTYDIPTIVIGTKFDKVPRSKWQKHERDLLQTLAISEEYFIPFSSTTLLNKDLVWELLNEVALEEYK